MCKELEISRDSYYKWIKRKNKINSYEERRDSYKPLFVKYYKLSNGTAGYRQIRDQIEEHEKLYLSDYMAYIIKYKELKLPEIRKKKNIGKYKININLENNYTYKNIAENMDITDVNQVLSTDTTEVKLETGKENVSFIIDAYTTEILVSCISKKLDNDFIEQNMNL